MQHARLLVPVHGAELEQTQGQLAVAARPAAIDEDVEGAVHRLEVVLGAPVQLHGWEHPVGEPVQVARCLEEVLLGDVRRVDELVACLLVTLARVVLEQLAHQPTLGVEHSQPRPDLLREGEEIELGPETAVVAAARLLALRDESVELLTVEERSAIHTLQLLVALVTTPVDTGDAQQADGAQMTAVGHVGAAAEVDEVTGAVDADALDIVRHAVDEIHLEALAEVGEQLPCRRPRHDLTLERDPSLGQLLHPCLDAGQVLLGEVRAVGETEVVEEPLVGGGPDVVRSAGEQFHHRRGHQVRGAVAEDVERQLGRRVDRRPGLGGVVDDLVRHEREL